MHDIAALVRQIIANKGPFEIRPRIERYELDSVLNSVYAQAKMISEPMLLELKPYDFPNVNRLWTEDGAIDYELARHLTGKLVNTVMQRNNWSFIELVQNITQNMTKEIPVNRFGTKASKMLGKVYRGSHSEAIIDLVNNDAQFKEWNDLRSYDFKKTNKRAPEERHEMTHLLLQKLQRDTNTDFVQLINVMRDTPEQAGVRGWKDAFSSVSINRYGTTLQGLIDAYGDSPANAILDLVKNNESYADYRDLQPFDFPDQRNIWNLKNGGKNYELARAAIGALLKKQLLDKEILPVISQTIGNFEFQNEPINRYGTTLSGMLNRVYSGRVSAALQDWFKHSRI